MNARSLSASRAIDGAAGHPVMVRGTGSIGRRHLGVLRDKLGLDPIAMPVRAESRDELAALGFRVATSVEALAATVPRFSSIVATDTARHLADASALVPFGDVLIEKPLAPASTGVASFRRRVRALGRRAAVGFCLRFNRGLRHVRARLDDPGTIHAVRIECQSYLPDWRPRDFRCAYSARRDEGGVLRDLAHELDYAVWLFGMPSTVLCRTTYGRLGIESEESADLLWETTTGTTVSIRLDYLTRPSRRRLVVDGSRGTIAWDAIAQTVTWTPAGGEATVHTVPGTRDDEIAAELSAFLHRTDEDSLSELESAARIVALTDAACVSARERCWCPVSMPEVI